MVTLTPDNTPPRSTPPGNAQFGLRKKLGFAMFALPTLLPVLGWWLGGLTGMYALFSFFTLFVVYGFVPVADWLVGEDDRNPTDADVPALDGDRYYRILTALVVPLQLFNLAFCGWLFVNGVGGPIGQLGWLLSAGTVSGATTITTAHELIHKATKWERWTGGLLLSSVWYATFVPEHLYGHHRHVATPEDGSTAYLNEGVYHFIGRSLKNNARKGYELAAFRAKKQGHGVWSWGNEMVPLTLFSVALTALSFVLGGWMGLLFFLGQALAAISLLEIINYIEHYGLMREKLPNGRYERVQPRHSWNANHVFTNNLLFQLQRHSDHHANGARRYQTLRHFEEAPQLPFGYATAVVAAMVPPLWKRIMNPRVARAKAGGSMAPKAAAKTAAKAAA